MKFLCIHHTTRSGQLRPDVDKNIKVLGQSIKNAGKKLAIGRFKK
jgi:hypothetical protein